MPATPQHEARVREARCPHRSARLYLEIAPPPHPTPPPSSILQSVVRQDPSRLLLQRKQLPGCC